MTDLVLSTNDKKYLLTTLRGLNSLKFIKGITKRIELGDVPTEHVYIDFGSWVMKSRAFVPNTMFLALDLNKMYHLSSEDILNDSY